MVGAEETSMLNVPEGFKDFIIFLKSLPEKTSPTIRFFNRGDYYTVHDAEADLLAKDYYQTNSGLKTYRSDNDILKSLVVSKPRFETIARDLLLLKQHRVEVYVNHRRGTQDWVAEFKGSPGNLNEFEDLLFTSSDETDSPSVIAIKVNHEGDEKVVGLGYVNMSDRQLSVSKFPDDDRFTHLESVVVHLGPKECLLPAGEASQDYSIINEIMEKSNVLVTPRKKNEFVDKELMSVLNRIVAFPDGQPKKITALPETKLGPALCGLSALVRYFGLAEDPTNEKSFTLNSFDFSKFMHVDTAGMRALNVFPRSSHSADKKNSLLGLLDRCRTAQGRRLLLQWIKHPLKDHKAISDRHDVVEMLLKNNNAFESLYIKLLCQVPDLHSLWKKLSKMKAILADCYKIYQTVCILPDIINSLKSVPLCPNLQTTFINPLEELSGDMKKFQELITSTLDLNEVEKGNFLIKADFDAELAECRSVMDKCILSMEKEIPRVAVQLGLEGGKSIKLESAPHLGYYFRVTLKDEKILRNRKDYEILDISKSGIRFRNSKLGELYRVYREAWSKYNEKQRDSVRKVLEVTASYSGCVHNLGCVLAQLDVLTSFAQVARDSTKGPYVRPEMLEMGSGVISLKRARHPCLELSVQYVANDVYLKQGESTFHIITGPNMGGKSTYIRSVSVIVFLAQLGCFVPCDEAKISIVDAIFARIGADDSLLKGMSTFMKEMVETSSVLRAASQNSLVVIDELGRGTSTYEGCGIAWSIAEHLASNIKAFCLFATHYHELTHLVEEITTVENFHVNAIIDKDRLILTYEIKPGASDESFGIHVAEMAGFPTHVIDRAVLKQAHLEDYQRVFTTSDTNEKIKVFNEGEKIIAKFLAKCRDIVALENVGEGGKIDEIEKCRSNVRSKSNSYIHALTSQK